MSKGIIALDMPDKCVECTMCYHAEDMSMGNLTYRRLYRCRIEPENLEDPYLQTIFRGKPDWCPIKPLPGKAHHEEYCDNGRYDKGWNDCLDEIEGGIK